MESNVVEVQFLYAPRVGQCSVIVSTEDEQTQMSLAELKEQFPMLCAGLSQMFDMREEHESEEDYMRMQEEEHERIQLRQLEEDYYDHFMKVDDEKNEAIKEMLNENWSEEDKLKWQALKEKIANQ
jgi:hypothetical protein